MKKSIKYPDVKPQYIYDKEYLKPRKDNVHIDFGKQISPRRSAIGILKHHDSQHGRVSSLNNQISKKKCDFKTIDFQATSVDYTKVYKGVDKLHKKSDFCFNHFDRQMPRDDRQFYINEAYNLDHLKKVEKPSPFTKRDDGSDLAPFRFMAILPHRVKLSKIYDSKFIKMEDHLN